MRHKSTPLSTAPSLCFTSPIVSPHRCFGPPAQQGIEYPKLEETHKDHQLPLLALHSTIQKSDHVIRALSKLSLSSGCATALGSLLCAPLTLPWELR